MLTVLKRADRPEDYELPAEPAMPAGMAIRDAAVKPIGWAILAASALAAGFHYLRYGPDDLDEGDA